MQTAEYRDLIARGIADGVIAYMKTRNVSNSAAGAQTAHLGRSGAGQ